MTGSPVVLSSTGKLGVSATSSARFKEAVKPMDKASEAILQLKPVTFRHKEEIDPDGIAQFGLVAEEVEKVNPQLVICDEDGKPTTVRYEAVNAMLLNEFLKEHRKVEEQEAKIVQQRKDFQATTTKLEATITQLQSTVAKQEATIAQQQKDFQSTAAQQQKEIKALTASLKRAGIANPEGERTV
jgi:septal ring factor EnvC (AmiA/AmiB activator)